MQKELALMSPAEYRAWFICASAEEREEKVVKPFLNRPLMTAAQYNALLERKAPEWAAQKTLRLQQAKSDRLKNYGAAALALMGWACIATYIFQERITELVGACLQL
jgi:hypothetical protein